MAAKGIKTKPIKHPKVTQLEDYISNQIKHYIKASNGKEWIAEIIEINGNVMLNDVQFSDKTDYSELKWDMEDDMKVIGYIHYHPPGIKEEFSAQDFELASTIHNLRKNKEKYTYTIMGVVSKDYNDKITAKFYGIKPKKPFKVKDMEVKVESDFKDKLDKMEQNQELIKIKEMVV